MKREDVNISKIIELFFQLDAFILIDFYYKTVSSGLVRYGAVHQLRKVRKGKGVCRWYEPV